MFDESFSFGAPSRSPSLDSTTSTNSLSRSISPCTMSAPFPFPQPQPQPSISDLTAQFAGQSIRPSPPVRYDSCASYANPDDDAGWSIPCPADPAPMDEECLTRPQFPQLQRPYSPSRRSQRQLSTRLLCSASHRSAIATLVGAMIEGGLQCHITGSPVSEDLHPSSLIPDEDEALGLGIDEVDVDEGYTSSDAAMTDGGDEGARRGSNTAASLAMMRMEIRRASLLGSSGVACVNKSIRVRRDRHGRRGPVRGDRA